MLPKKNRIRTRFEFGKVKKHGFSHAFRYFYLNALPVWLLKDISQGRWDIPNYTKVGFLVSKKLHKKAVIRNKIKRIFRECVRKNFGKIEGAWWLVFTPKKSCLQAGYEEICFEINKALQEISVSGQMGNKNLSL